MMRSRGQPCLAGPAWLPLLLTYLSLPCQVLPVLRSSLLPTEHSRQARNSWSQPSPAHTYQCTLTRTLLSVQKVIPSPLFQEVLCDHTYHDPSLLESPTIRGCFGIIMMLHTCIHTLKHTYGGNFIQYILIMSFPSTTPSSHSPPFHVLSHINKTKKCNRKNNGI